MAIASSDESTSQKPIRLWPGVVAVALQWLAWLVVPLIAPEALLVAMVGGIAGGLAVVVWWLFFSRAPWAERLGAIALMVALVAATKLIVHPSLANGMMGMLLPIYAVPACSLALVFWAVAARRLSGVRRHSALVAAGVLACGAFALLRTDGVTGGGDSDFHWRWTPTSEQRLLAQGPAAPEVERAPGPPPSAPPMPGAPPERPAAVAIDNPGLTSATLAVPASVAEWTGFRGPNRDGIVRGMRIETDWTRDPPVRLWRRAVGPGWSSFAVHGDLVYTQEQRGDDEIVSCYRVSTGEPVWMHHDAARFWESNAGAGPRATPTLSDGRVYTLGATGILNALDAGTGAVVWSRNAATDADAKVPIWGFAGSPLVIHDLVIVAAAGKLVAYDIAAGTPRWSGPARGGSYSSPHRATIGGVEQVLLQSDAGLTSVAPASGALLWDYAWPGAAIVQPALLADGDVLASTAGPSGGIGIRRLAIAHGPGGWKVEERWTSAGLKPYFNDFVVHKGHAFGFDGSILACIDLENGARRWKGGRYGNGQTVLFPEQDLLLVLSEEGELALVGATPDQFRELARFPGIDGKTWNHPVLAGHVLLIRNDQEMAAFRLALAGR